jgi:hypothetical protein
MNRHLISQRQNRSKKHDGASVLFSVVFRHHYVPDQFQRQNGSQQNRNDIRFDGAQEIQNFQQFQADRSPGFHLEVSHYVNNSAVTVFRHDVASYGYVSSALRQSIISFVTHFSVGIDN